MAQTLSAKRLRKELMLLQREPVENITALPLESNILVWHYVLKGAKNSPYEGGYYHGKLKFPPEYPLKPPSIMMITPSGRFKPNTRLCLSMSDFHPESWNPMWSVSTILMGLQAFMLDNAPTLGSIETSVARKRQLAAQAMEFNLKTPNFPSMFPDLVAEYEENRRKAEEERAASGGGVAGGLPPAQAVRNGHMDGDKADRRKADEPGLMTLLICVSVTIAVLAIVLRLSG